MIASASLRLRTKFYPNFRIFVNSQFPNNTSKLDELLPNYGGQLYKNVQFIIKNNSLIVNILHSFGKFLY